MSGENPIRGNHGQLMLRCRMSVAAVWSGGEASRRWLKVVGPRQREWMEAQKLA